VKIAAEVRTTDFPTKVIRSGDSVEVQSTRRRTGGARGSASTGAAAAAGARGGGRTRG